MTESHPHRPKPSMVDLLGQRDAADIVFEPPRMMTGPPRIVDFASEPEPEAVPTPKRPAS